MALVKENLKSPFIPLCKGGNPIAQTALLVIVVATLSLPADTAHAAKLYKWVDENGQVHFSDKIPPQDIKREHSEVDKQGLEVKSVEAAKTPEQIAEEKRQQAIKAEQDRIAKEKAEQDRILLETFSNEGEIIDARNRQLATMEASNQITMGSIESLTIKLQDQTKTAADFERQGQPVPESVLKEIDEIKIQIEKNRASIKTKEMEQLRLKEKYDGYVARFRELKGL